MRLPGAKNLKKWQNLRRVAKVGLAFFGPSPLVSNRGIGASLNIKEVCGADRRHVVRLDNEE